MHNILFIRMNQINSFDNIDWLYSDSKGKIIDCNQNNDSVTLKDLTVRFDQDYRVHNKIKTAIIIPDNLVNYHLAELPIKTSNKRKLATPFILEDEILSELDNTCFIEGPLVKKDHYLIAVSNRKILQSVISLLKTDYDITPSYILTDAICLYSKYNNTNLFINKKNNTAIIVNNTLIVVPLNNLVVTLQQLLGQKETLDNSLIDIYKHDVTNLNDIFDTVKVNIGSEHQIDAWLPFLVKSWFFNRRFNKFNLLNEFIKPKLITFSVNKLWHKTATLLSLTIVLLFIYKFLDNKFYAPKKIELDRLISQKLSAIDLPSVNLDNADQLIDRQIRNIQSDIESLNKKHKFINWLDSFIGALNNNKFKINNIQFDTQSLTIGLNINFDDTQSTTDRLKIIDDIANLLSNQNLKVQKSYTDSKNKVSNTVFVLSE